MSNRPSIPVYYPRGYQNKGTQTVKDSRVTKSTPTRRKLSQYPETLTKKFHTKPSKKNIQKEVIEEVTEELTPTTPYTDARYVTEQVTIPTFTNAIPIPSYHAGQLIGTILSTTNKPLLVTWDTGAGCSMIERAHLLENFHPRPKLQTGKGDELSGVGNVTLAQLNQYVSLPIRLLTTENQIVTFECPKVWVCDNFLVDAEDVGPKEAQILIGNDFLRNHRLGVEWGERGTRDYLVYKGREGTKGHKKNSCEILVCL